MFDFEGLIDYGEAIQNQNCFDIFPSSKCLGTGAVQSWADFNIRTEEVFDMHALLFYKLLLWNIMKIKYVGISS